jgi:hypothetical protein
MELMDIIIKTILFVYKDGAQEMATAVWTPPTPAFDCEFVYTYG